MITKQLQDNQLASFDRDYVSEEMWPFIYRNIEKSFPSGEFSLLDIGGGNGRFADMLLAKYDKARAVVLDNSSLLLEKNKASPRKATILESAERLDIAVA